MLCMCPHAIHTRCMCVLIIYMLCMCPHTMTRLRCRGYLCVLILLYIVSSYCCMLCSRTAVYCVLMLLYIVSSYCYILCPHTAIYCVLLYIVSSYCCILCPHAMPASTRQAVCGWVFYICVLILLCMLCMCPHAIHTRCMCVLILYMLCMCPHTTA
jgi:hypothetical protein